MKKVLELYKKEGETPLETIERFKIENPEYKDEKMTYAGRLDPMAEGVLLVLVGDECKNKDKYLGLDKEYEFEILWGFQTDTYDILGIPVLQNKNFEEPRKVAERTRNYAEIGKFKQKYPPYSSMTVDGKQLFQWAREGKLDEIEIPEREVEIYKVEFLGDRKITKKDLLENILTRIDKVSGDFRQPKIKKEWVNLLTDFAEAQLPQEFVISKVKIKCSGGTYVRGIVNDIFKAIAFSIKRTKIFC